MTAPSPVGPRACWCADPGRTEDEMLQCPAGDAGEDCLAHDYLAVGGSLHVGLNPRLPQPDLSDLRQAVDAALTPTPRSETPMPEKPGKPLTVEDLAPWPETEEDATAEAMAKHFAAFAQLHFRLGLDLSDRGEAAESARAFISFHDLAFLFREIKAAGVGVADRVARALWESAEHPHTLGPDVWAWLEEYGIDPEQVNKIAAGFVVPLPLGEEA